MGSAFPFTSPFFQIPALILPIKFYGRVVVNAVRHLSSHLLDARASAGRRQVYALALHSTRAGSGIFMRKLLPFGY